MTSTSLLSNVNCIPDILLAQSNAKPKAIAIEHENGQLTYEELWRLIRDVISLVNHSFQYEGRSNRIGIMHDNGPGMAALLLGVCSVATALPFNPSYSISELRSYFISTNLDGLVLPKSGYIDVENLAHELSIPVLRIEWNNPRKIDAKKTKIISMPRSQDIAIILLTSGSTGKSKAVPLSHKNITTSAFQVVKSLELTEKDRCLCMWEQYHIGGLVDLLLAPLISGGTVIVTAGFSTNSFFELLKSSKPTWFQGVPTTLGALKTHAKRYQLNVSNTSLRLLRSVAAPLSSDLQSELEYLFDIPVIQTFGMTEAGPLISSTLLPPYERKRGSVGRPCGTTIALYSLEGNLLSSNEEGVVAIKGENVFTGYEHDDEANTSSFRDGWFFTGDLGYLDNDGDLFLTGRIKQLINRGGEKINPQEVDNVLMTYPDIAEAACFSVPHPTLGEDIMAAIVFQQGRYCETELIRTYLIDKLASFKIPSKIIAVDKIPLNSIGKVDRIKCKELAEKLHHKIKPHNTPQSNIEKILANIWMTELDLEQIFLEDNFFELGGDSLSSARIILAVEKYFNIKIPDKDVLILNTINQMAEYIDKNLKLDITVFGTNQSLTKNDFKQLIISIENDLCRENTNHEDALRKLRSANTMAEFKLLSDTFSLYQTPLDLYRFLQSSLNLSTMKNNNSDEYHFEKWVKELKLDLDSYPSTREWKRTNLNPYTILYKSEKGIHSKKLIIGFGGNGMKLMVPTHIILGAIDESDFDLMFISDPNRNHYREGVRGVASSLNELSFKLKELATYHGYNEYIIFGVSAGGLPAIRTGQLLSAKHVLAVGPDNPLRHPNVLEQLISDKTTSTTFQICFSGNNKRDYEAAYQLKKVLPDANVIAFKGIERHGLLNDLHEHKKLKFFLDKHLLNEVR